MILVDAGPLVALIDPDEDAHQDCVRVLPAVTGAGPLLTTWLALTEAMYLVGSFGGWRAQERLWTLVRTDRVEPRDINRSGWERLYTLMERYRDVPMDLADASLVLLAEATGVDEVFSLDSDFDVYRIHDRKPFRRLP
jgi:predicted nucleic acid-binding protein